jgi:hypothetical protein
VSTHAELVNGLLRSAEVLESEVQTLPDTLPPLWNSDRFEEEQLRGLVRQVFFPGWPRPARQVVLSTIDENVAVSSTAIRIGRMMAAEIPGNVAVIEVFPLGTVAETTFGRNTSEQTDSDQRPALLRRSSRQILSNLWLVPGYVFLAQHQEGLSVSSLRGRLGELRLEFDYVLINAPPVNSSSEAALLGSLTDGVILIIGANTTRRAAARKGQFTLRQANARLLGAILCERTFPIPERLYRKL